jgi:hypothetical protein
MRLKVKSKTLLGFTLLTVFLTCPSGGQKPASEYATLRDRVKSGDLSIDFQRLRMSYVESPEHKKARSTDDQSQQMIQAINARDFNNAIKRSNEVLEQDYTDMDAHFGAQIAYRELGDAKQADFHRAVFEGLIKSILNSGDGKSAETAYVIVSVHEEYVVLRALHLQPQGQSLAHKGDHSYDVMKTKNQKTGEEVTVFFNADIPMRELNEIFGGKK